LIDARSSAENDATIGNDGAISNPAFYREYYYPDGNSADSDS
jgi:hypothetical protein